MGDGNVSQTRQDEWTGEKSPGRKSDDAAKRQEAVKADSWFFERNRRFLWSTIEPTPKRRQELDVRY